MNVNYLTHGGKKIGILVVPARILEAVVEKGQPLKALQNFEAVSDILTPDDLLFYKGVNMDITGLIPSPVLKAIDYHNDETHRRYFNKAPAEYVAEDIYPFPDHQPDSTFEKECAVYMETNYPGTVASNAHFIAHCKSNDALTHSSTRNVNNYVGQYFAISPNTIGVTLTITDSPNEGLRDAVEGLLALLYDAYLRQDVTSSTGVPLASVDRHSFCLRKLSQSGLVAYYCTLLSNK